MENLSEMLKGVLQGIVLEIINQKEVYGYEIVRRLTQMGFSGMTEGTVYTILMRLERNKYVTITKKASELGPPRKFYTLNEQGKSELTLFWGKWNFLKDRVEMLKNQGGNTNGY